jgi:hypothetical protein
MRTRVLEDGFSPLRSKKSHKKLDKNIGHHPKKKKKERQKCSNVYLFHLYAQRNHSLKKSLFGQNKYTKDGFPSLRTFFSFAEMKNRLLCICVFVFGLRL